MVTSDSLKATLRPICEAVSGLDLTDPVAAKASLDAALPFATLGEVRAQLIAARDAGWLAPKRATPTLTFGRVAKATPETCDLSIDVVDMEGAGGEHAHPNGEVSLCFATDGDPRFVGFPEGWVVVPPGSRHVPLVTGGRMLITYFLPRGAISFV